MTTNWPPMNERGPVVSNDDVCAFEAQLGTTLPEDYRQFLLDVNGGQPARGHHVFTFQLKRCTPNHSSVNSLHGLNDPDERFNLGVQNEFMRHRSPSAGDLLHIGDSGYGTTLFLALRGEHRGEVWILDIEDERPDGSNPRVLWHDRRDMACVAPNFREFMLRLEGSRGG